MALHIGRVDAEMEIREDAASPSADIPLPASKLPSDDELRERLRPAVLAILEEELARFRRWRG